VAKLFFKLAKIRELLRDWMDVISCKFELHISNGEEMGVGMSKGFVV